MSLQYHAERSFLGSFSEKPDSGLPIIDTVYQRNGAKPKSNECGDIENYTRNKKVKKQFSIWWRKVAAMEWQNFRHVS